MKESSKLIKALKQKGYKVASGKYHTAFAVLETPKFKIKAQAKNECGEDVFITISEAKGKNGNDIWEYSLYRTLGCIVTTPTFFHFLNTEELIERIGRTICGKGVAV
jgi:hypothetical protein